ncbi:uncharacterized protein K452DRAFT_333430 [Aplosporella prunicola CBS 121167]|uniref:Uncharacterized protein n=1 Tax=Aplosporella prunicola CBS 121167 TaxID=1176127 RepID=A0A6A6BFJ2_9PEZI|nr:uncharacterized protein K452DRAFT_333430 [Aplosporella prunicola CBS 121167]KAF2141687.1 hypothetical protein K452DRAFT_333430 [Aplosporella prunicola CBS 121167]
MARWDFARKPMRASQRIGASAVFRAARVSGRAALKPGATGGLGFAARPHVVHLVRLVSGSTGLVLALGRSALRLSQAWSHVRPYATQSSFHRSSDSLYRRVHCAAPPTRRQLQIAATHHVSEIVAPILPCLGTPFRHGPPWLEISRGSERAC